MPTLSTLSRTPQLSLNETLSAKAMEIEQAGSGNRPIDYSGPPTAFLAGLPDGDQLHMPTSTTPMTRTCEFEGRSDTSGSGHQISRGGAAGAAAKRLMPRVQRSPLDDLSAFHGAPGSSGVGSGGAASSSRRLPHQPHGDGGSGGSSDAAAVAARTQPSGRRARGAHPQPDSMLALLASALDADAVDSRNAVASRNAAHATAHRVDVAQRPGSSTATPSLSDERGHLTSTTSSRGAMRRGGESGGVPLEGAGRGDSGGSGGVPLNDGTGCWVVGSGSRCSLPPPLQRGSQLGSDQALLRSGGGAQQPWPLSVDDVPPYLKPVRAGSLAALDRHGMLSTHELGPGELAWLAVTRLARPGTAQGEMFAIAAVAAALLVVVLVMLLLMVMALAAVVVSQR